MKKLLLFATAAIFLSSCSAAKKTTTGKEDQKKLNKLTEQAIVKQAVESRQYVIKMDRLYVPGGTFVDLVPEKNYLIVSMERASVSLLYMGRTMGMRPISAINFNGHAVTYEMKSEETKGVYTINMRVRTGSDNFDFNISVGSNGLCTLSVVNAYIQTVRYRGNVFLMPESSKKESDVFSRL